MEIPGLSWDFFIDYKLQQVKTYLTAAQAGEDYPIGVA